MPVSLIPAQFGGFSELDHQGVLMLAHAKMLLVLSFGSPHFKHENQFANTVKTEGKTIQPRCTKRDTIGQNSHEKRLRRQPK